METKKARQRYSKKKTDHVELVFGSNKTLVEIAGDLYNQAEPLYRWKAEYQAKHESLFTVSGNLKNPEAKRFHKLERELQVNQERTRYPQKGLGCVL